MNLVGILTLDHHSRQRLRARVAKEHATPAVETLLNMGQLSRDAWQLRQRQLPRNGDVDQDLGQSFEVGKLGNRKPAVGRDCEQV